MVRDVAQVVLWGLHADSGLLKYYIYICDVIAVAVASFFYPMRKILLFIVMCLPIVSGARGRDLESARGIAYDFMNSRVVTKSSEATLNMVYDGQGSSVTRSVSQMPAYYVFDNETGPGFVIVSGDDAVQPILGYSDVSDFRVDGMPSNLRWWLEIMKSQINSVRSSGTATSDRRTSPGTPEVLYETAKWDQWEPFSSYCPSMMYNGQEYVSVTGCGPTAMAIVLRSKQYPSRGSGATDEYVTPTNGMTVPSRTLGEEYDWDNMPLTSPYYHDWTDEQCDQVARLMADIGAAAKVDYGIANGNDSGTSIYNTDVVPALTKYFGFDKSAYIQERGYLSDREWYSALKNEISINGPMIYRGQSSEGGHMFVLDGYDSNDYFHVNWGWSGSGDGYYSLSAMNPGDQGAGSFDGGYNQLQAAVFNLIPDEGGETPMQIGFYCFENEYDTYRGIHVKEFDPITGYPSLVNIGAIWNMGSVTCYGLTTRLVVVDDDMNVVRVLWEYMYDYGLPPTYYYYFYDEPLADYGYIDFGYSLIAQYYDPNNNEWKMIRANKETGGIDRIYLAEKYTIEESTSFRYDNSTGMVRLKTKDGVEVRCIGDFGEIVVEETGENVFVINTRGLDAGVYTIVLTKGIEYKELRFVVGSKQEDK